jgi:serine/threonine protein kinase
MGEVFEALDHQHDARVALKLLTAMTSTALLRFKNEFRALRDLEHPNVVSLGELLEEEGHWFFTMEFVDGVDFLTWVRRDSGPAAADPTTVVTAASAAEVPAPRAPAPAAKGSLDEGRLREGLAQLASGLTALHAAGKVHRDIKPSNIRVSHEGRVVLLDFGLVSELEQAIDVTDADNVVGTPVFMAPEQAAMRELGPEADWYSVGVILYVALTGRLPFGGSGLSLLLHKQQHEPPPPRTLIADLPADLEKLCVDLLRIDPSARPSDAEILRRLGVAQAEPAPPSVPFVGRAPELQLLRDAFERTRRGRATTVYIHGESGVGKSALVRRFCDSMAAERGAVVLAGRCFPNESVPFKGVDGLIDSLSRYLMGLPHTDAAALLPGKASLMTQVFPVLLSVEAIAGAPTPLEEVRDPQELRSRAFTAVRELLTRLAERRPVILLVDDMQWSDADSLALLREVLRPPEAPALMLMLTDRAVKEETGCATMPGQVEHVSLWRLPASESLALAQALLGRHAGGDAALPQAIAEEAAGHPLFIDELARRALHGSSGRLRLEEALWERIEHLDLGARSILDVLAVAGAPLPKECAALAVAMDFGEFAKRVSQLRVAHLLRGSDAADADSIELYHDRVRAAVLPRLAADDLTACSWRVAFALEASGTADPEALAIHWRGAGEHAKAATYALRAARHAAKTLAFERAAQLYQLALELGVPAVEEQDIRVQLGDALKNAGRGPDAARAYLAAAEHGEDAAFELEMRRRAAEQLLRSGYLDEGLQTLRGVLDAVGMELPATPARALTALLYHRARLRVRGLRFSEHAADELPSEELTRLDVAWSASTGLSLIDHIRAADFQCQNLLHALRTGEPHRIARALAVEAGHSSTRAHHSEQRTTKLLAASEALALRLGDQHALGIQKMVAGMAALLSGRWQAALELCDQAEAILRARCSGVSWEIGSAARFAADALWFMGMLREHARRVPLLLDEAQARGDLYGAINFRTIPLGRKLLVDDRPDDARRQIHDAMAGWSHSGVHAQHYYELYSLGHVDLYQGHGAAAHARVLERWTALRRAQLFRVELIRLHATDLRARAALAAAEVGGHRPSLLRAARRDAQRVAAGRMPWCVPTARLLDAGAAALAGDRDRTATELRSAACGFDEAGMPMHAAAARLKLGLLLGGDEGAALLADARAWFDAQAVASPARLTAMLAPGLTDLD